MTDVFRKEYKPLTANQQDLMNSIKDKAKSLYDDYELALKLENTGFNARYIALAKTTIEESVMWAIKGIT